MKNAAAIFLAVLSVAGCAAPSQQASTAKDFGANSSDQPGDYELFSDCVTNGPVKVCRGLQMTGAIALDITYTGSLAAVHSGDGQDISTVGNGYNLQMFLQADYQNSAPNALFPLTATSDIPFSQTRITNGCLVGDLHGRCTTQGTTAMDSVLIYAGQGSAMVANALDLEVAFTANGAWDSGQNGSNYKIHFDQHSAN